MKRMDDAGELRAEFHDEEGRTLTVVVTDEGVIFDTYRTGRNYHSGEEATAHVGTRGMMADEWFEELTPRTNDYWEDHERADDWRYEVANGDTRQGFWEWLEAHDE